MVEKLRSPLAPILPSGYVDWMGSPPRTKDEAVQKLLQLGYCGTNPTYVASAILDDAVIKMLGGLKHILLVYEVSTGDTQFGSAYQVCPLVQKRDKEDFIMQTFAGGRLSDAVFMYKDMDEEIS